MNAPPHKVSFVVSEETAGMRLDQCLSRHVEQLSRRTAKLALDIGCVFLNRKRVKTASREVAVGDRIDAHLGGAFQRAISAAAPIVLPAHEVLFEDTDLVVVTKPAGLLTAPTPEGDRNTLLHALETRGPRKARLYVVHRLDLQTSGVLVFAKTASANRSLSELFRRHDLTRQYDVFVAGEFPAEQRTVSSPVGGKHAVTHLKRLAVTPTFSWLEATLETGRTHQIRRHLAELGHPVLSDPEYGPPAKRTAPRLALHAKRLAFAHPFDGRALDFRVDLPEDLATWLAAVSPA
jgi:23S rRNA pseudouridine1911/1915/1917 synthase